MDIIRLFTKYLIQASYTADGTKGLIEEGGINRRAAVIKAVTGLGGTLESFYNAFGDVDVYTIISMPDTISAVAMGLAIKSSGLITATVTTLLEPEDINKAADLTGSGFYRAPGLKPLSSSQPGAKGV